MVLGIFVIVNARFVSFSLIFDTLGWPCSAPGFFFMLLFLSSELVPHFLSVCRYRKFSLQMGAVYLVVNRVRGGTGYRWRAFLVSPPWPSRALSLFSILACSGAVVFGKCLTTSLEVKGHPDLQHFLISMQLKLSHRYH